MLLHLLDEEAAAGKLGVCVKRRVGLAIAVRGRVALGLLAPLQAARQTFAGIADMLNTDLWL